MYRLIIATLLVSFFASCNSGNKIASSFGKRKYTKGYYFASSGNKKSVLPVSLPQKIGETNTSIGSNENDNSIHSVRTADINKKPFIVSSSISAPAKIKKVFISSLFQALGVPATKFSSPDGIPGHASSSTAADSSGYDGIATAAMILGLACLLLILGAIVFASGLFIEGSGDLYVALIYLCALLATIFGYIGHKSERYHGRATVGKVIGLIILIGTLALFVLVIAILTANGGFI